MPDVEQQKKNKKKKKPNFLRFVKKYGKKGFFGKGKTLTEEQYNYYIRVYEQLKHVEGEEKEILVRNFISEFMREDHEINLACSQLVSHVLEQALPSVDVSQLVDLTKIFGEEVYTMCTDPFSSHIIQTLLVICLRYVQEDASQMRHERNEEDELTEKNIPVTEEEKSTIILFLNKVCKLVSNNLEDFISNTYASHIVCSVIMVCSGVDVEDTIKSKSENKHGLSKEESKVMKVPEILQPILKDMARRFIILPDITGIVTSNCTSIVAQTLILVLWKKGDQKLCNSVITHILENGFPGISSKHGNCSQNEMAYVDIPPLFENNAATHLLQILITCVPSEKHEQIYLAYFKGYVKTLVQSANANFAVQSLLSAWSEKEDFKDLYDEMADALEAAAKVKHTGVIYSFIKACRQLSTHQCIQAMMKLHECSEPERQGYFAPLILGFETYDNMQQRKSEGSELQINLHGSLIVQELLQFKKPKQIVHSLLEMDANDLVKISCNRRGSHVMTSYFTSEYVGSKNWEKMFLKLQGNFTVLACDKHGSRTLEDIWKIASIKMKTTMCNELVQDNVKIKENPFGKIIHSNFMLSVFVRNDKSDWQELVQKYEKKRKTFDDIIKDAEEHVKKTRKSKKTD